MRLVPIAATPLDEVEFLAFLGSLSEVRLFRWYAHTGEGIWVKEFDPEPQLMQAYFIWNASIPWCPDAPTSPDWRGPLSQRFHVANFEGAPVLEIQRSKVDRGQYGWIQSFGNESNEFAVWLRDVMGWIRSTAKLVKKPYGRYFFPDAWNVYLRLQSNRKNWAASANAWWDCLPT
jgi:hypothetical protein